MPTERNQTQNEHLRRPRGVVKRITAACCQANGNRGPHGFRNVGVHVGGNGFDIFIIEFEYARWPVAMSWHCLTPC